MRAYTQEVEIDIEDILADVGRDLPTPACPVYRGSVEVTISGKDTPARIFCRNEDAQPAEYREAEADKHDCELAWEVWAAYDKQVGPLPLADRDDFLRAAEIHCMGAIVDAEDQAMEQDNEPLDDDYEPERDGFRELRQLMR